MTDIDWDQAQAAVWRSKEAKLKPIIDIDAQPLQDLIGIDAQKQALFENTDRFLQSRPANHALLWGARGTGKSSLIKALCHQYRETNLRMIEVFKHDLSDLHAIVDVLRNQAYRFLIYCDDLSFSQGDHSYSALKTLLQGSLERPAENVLLYATSNRRHLVAEKMLENQEAEILDGELHYGDTTEEKISLADRFGLWLSFPPLNQADYLRVVDHYCKHHPLQGEELHAKAIRFAHYRGCRNARTAEQFFRSIS